MTTTATSLRGEKTKKTGRGWKIAFYIPIALFIIAAIMFLAVLPPFPLLFYLFIGWTNPMESMGMQHHHFHEFIFSTFMLTVSAGCIAQFFRAKSKAAPMLQAAVALTLMILVAIVSGSFDVFFLFFLVPVLAATALHPLGIRNLFKTTGNLDLRLLGLIAAAAVPLVLYAVEHVGLQSNAVAGDDHAEFMHWGFMAASALSIIAFGLLAAFRLSGWRITAWSAAAIAFIFGLTSVLFPAQTSAVGPVWGSIAIIWSAVFGLTAQFGDRIGSAAVPKI